MPTNLNNTNMNPGLSEIIQVGKLNKVICDGPLSIAYTKALNELYAKEIDPKTGIVLESQSNDQITAQNLWIASKINDPNFIEQGQDVGMLYGVMKNNATMADTINLAETYSEMTPAQREASAVILDEKVEVDSAGNTNIDDQVLINPFDVALEQFAKKHGIAFYTSLESYVQHCHGLK
jgi:hypothetical protein